MRGPTTSFHTFFINLYSKGHPLSFRLFFIHPVIQRVAITNLGGVKCQPFLKCN